MPMGYHSVQDFVTLAVNEVVVVRAGKTTSGPDASVLL